MSEPFCLHVDNIPLGLVCNITWQADTLPRGQACGGERLSRQAMARYARLRGCDSLVLARERFGILQRAGMRHGSVGNGTLTPARHGKRLSLAVLAQRHLAKGVAVLCLPTSEGLLYWVWAAKDNVLSARGDVLVSARGKALKLAQSIAASLGLTGPRVFDEDESLALLRELARAATREKAGEAALLPLEPVSLGRIVLVSLMGLLAAALLIGGQTMWEWWETRARTTLLSQTREELAKAIETTVFKTPVCPVYQNVTALPSTDPDVIKKNLLSQLTSPVKWTQTVKNMIADGADYFMEIGPGAVLQGLIKKTAGDTVQIEGIATLA